MSAAAGKFVVLEGTDGSGTTTQCSLLIEALSASGIPVIGTQEPTAGPVGQLLRSALEQRLTRNSGKVATLIWTTLALLFAADRTDHVCEEVAPALGCGVWVVSDRYDLSSFIYQSLTAPNAETALRWVRELNVHAPRPDLTVVLDVDAETARVRRQSRGGAEELFERRDLQARLAEAYIHAERFALRDTLVHVDATLDVESVHARVLEAVRFRLLT